ncbi:MAG: diguanylate cyclase [Rhodoferax sp.]
MIASARQLLFGSAPFAAQQEQDEFRYKFLIVLMVSGALFTAVFIAGDLSYLNQIGTPHRLSMLAFTSGALCLWLLLRAHPGRLLPVAWAYEVLGLAEYTSALVHVPQDELRLLWFYVNVPGVFIVLGQRAGWAVTALTMLGLGLGNAMLSNPYSANALATALLSMLYLGVFFHAYVGRSQSYFARVQAYNQELLALASHDALTGVYNTRAYHALCEPLIQACLRAGQVFSVLFIDLDHFKAVNDTHGHDAGDAVLRTVAATLQRHIRKSDVLARIGGEEFSIFLPNTGQRGALALAEQLRDAVQVAQVALPGQAGQGLSVTASIGVSSASAMDAPITMPALQQRADAAMYAAKRAGRNRVSCLDVSPGAPSAPPPH